MDGWKRWQGKKIFLRTKNNRVYTGIVEEVNEEGMLTFFTIKDKFDKIVCFVSSEILEIKEEE